MEILVREGIAVPVTVRKTAGSKKFQPVYSAMDKLVNGQSFEFKPEVDAALKNPVGNAVYNCRKYGAKLEGKKFTVKELEGGIVGVWCIESPVVAEVPAEQPANVPEGE